MENRAYFTIGQAAKETGKAKSTIKKAIDSGDLSVAEKTNRGFKIEAAELFRVFPKRSENVSGEQEETTEDKGKTPENSILQVKLEAMEQRFTDAQTTIEDLRERLTKSEDERTRITTLLTHQQSESAGKKGFWGRLFGG